MEEKTSKNFHKRFGDRINVSFADKPLQPTEQKVQNEALCRAVAEVMAGVLKRAPTEEELLGLEDISTHKPKRKA